MVSLYFALLISSFLSKKKKKRFRLSPEQKAQDKIFIE